MEMIERLKQIAFSLAIIGFFPALFLWAQTSGLGMQTDKSKALSRIPFSGTSGLGTFEDIALRYCFILVCFLLFIIFLLIRNKIFLKVTGLIPLVFILVQCRLLIIRKKELFSIRSWEYSSWLETTYYMDFGFLALAVVLLILQLYLIWHVYRSSIYNSP